jgi:excisionase family DNA binding protein
MYTSYDQLPLFLTVEQLAEVIGVGRNTAYAMVRSGQVHSFKAGNQFRIPKEVIKNLIKYN